LYVFVPIFAGMQKGNKDMRNKYTHSWPVFLRFCHVKLQWSVTACQMIWQYVSF